VRPPTPDEIRAARTPKGGWTAAQLAEWGVKWPPPAGWRKRLERASRQQAADGDVRSTTKEG